METFVGLMPPGTELRADVYGDDLVLIANRNTSGSACGFEWSDDDTFAAVIDLCSGAFKVPFHPIESLGAAAVAMLDPTVCFILGGGRTSASCYLRRADIASPQGRGTAPIHGIDVSLGSPPRVMIVEYAGRDSAGGILLCGPRYSGTGSILSRWTLDRPEFETVGRWDGPAGWFECAATLRDGSTLVFWRVKGENQTIVRRYVPGAEAVTMGRIGGADVVVCVGQASDGRVYVFGIEESVDADGRGSKKTVNRLSILTPPELSLG